MCLPIALLLLLPAGPVSAAVSAQPMRIPMRDGTQLWGVVYNPAGAARRPTILLMTPYLASRLHRHGMELAERGFAVAIVDVRGRGNSEGHHVPFETDGRDGYDTVEWLARQPFSNGRVGMTGQSNEAYIQWATYRTHPPHLVSILPNGATRAGYDFPSIGNVKFYFARQWLQMIDGRALNDDLAVDPALWLPAILAHQAAGRAFADFAGLGAGDAAFRRWIANAYPSSYWQGLAPSAADYRASRVAVLTVTGHHDAAQRAALSYHDDHLAAVGAAAPHHLLIGPWNHSFETRFRGLDFGPASDLSLVNLAAGWFGWTLADGPKPAFLKGPVTTYVADSANPAGGTWDVPAAGRRPTRWFLSTAPDGAHRLADGCCAGLATSFRSDPLDLAAVRATVALMQREGGIRYDDGGYHATMGTAGRAWQTAPLEDSRQLIGRPRLELWLRVDTPDADLQAQLHELRPDGKTIFLSEAVQRLRHRDGAEALVIPGKPMRVRFDNFTFVGRKVAAGSRLLLAVRTPAGLISDDDPLIERNYNAPGDVATQTARDARPVTVEILQSRQHPSILEVGLD